MYFILYDISKIFQHVIKIKQINDGLCSFIHTKSLESGVTFTQSTCQFELPTFQVPNHVMWLVVTAQTGGGKSFHLGFVLNVVVF